VYFQAGKNREGYFTTEKILDHATAAMDLLSKHYPDDDHVLVFDNATTHTARAADAISAQHMSKFPTKPGNPFFGVEVNVLGADGCPLYSENGKLKKTKRPMGDGTFKDGTAQSLYFPAGHPCAGVF
ncbi:hypothetical protein BXZ70DRAFT_858854, partial [Cristinia sonorae]